MYVDMIIGRRCDPEHPPKQARLTKWAWDVEGNAIGSAHPTNNPLLNTRVYEMEYGDGMTELIEVGPGKVLQGLVKKVDRAFPASQGEWQ